MGRVGRMGRNLRQRLGRNRLAATVAATAVVVAVALGAMALAGSGSGPSGSSGSDRGSRSGDARPEDPPAGRPVPPPGDGPTGVTLLEAEIAALVDAGTAEGDPRLEMLQDELAALRRGLRTRAPGEPGVDLSDVGPDRVRRERADRSLWDNGPVVCEPVPPGVVTAEEVAGATCRSLLRADGSSLYLVRRPDGQEIRVRFRTDGRVTRLP
jgi:hypothetical protein